VICAFGAIAFTCAGGLIVYTNTQHLIASRNWLDHSQSVLNSLQLESQRLDRLTYDMRLYTATGNTDELDAAQSTIVGLRAGVLSLENLVRDNPSQTSQGKILDSKVQQLSQALDHAKALREIPEPQIQACRQSVSVLQEQERALLKQRSDDSANSRDRSLLSGLGFLIFSLIVVIALFGFLLRDAIRRRRFEEEISVANDRLEATIEELERRGSEATLLKEARDELQLCVTSQEAQECAARFFQGLVPGSSGATLVINNSRSMLEIVAEWNSPSSLTDSFEMEACCGLRAGRPRWRRPGESELQCSHFHGPIPEHYVCIPLVAQGDTIGVVYLSCPTKEIADLAYGRMALVQEMVELASMAIAGLNLKAKLQRQSIRDGLTSLFNRHFMEIALERELHRAARKHVGLAVLMLDVDHFKVFNDTFGHEAGDVVLRSVAECLQQSVRSEDVVCRYGGEEFVIILPEISQELALERADAIRKNVANLRMKYRGEALRQISISVGLAMYPTPARDSADLLRMSDQALYDAKRAGRNRTHLAGSAPEHHTNHEEPTLIAEAAL
jgi:diguanylate cyclase (GGDEF)-like protein